MGGQTGPSFVFSTDATGNVSGWNISINYSDGTNNTEVAAQNPGTVVTGYGGQYVDGTYFDNVDKVSGPTSSVLDTASTAAGSWYCLAPLVDPLTAQVTALTAQVTTLQAQVTTLQSQLAAAQAKAAELQSHVAWNVSPTQVTDRHHVDQGRILSYGPHCRTI